MCEPSSKAQETLLSLPNGNVQVGVSDVQGGQKILLVEGDYQTDGCHLELVNPEKGSLGLDVQDQANPVCLENCEQIGLKFPEPLKKSVRRQGMKRFCNLRE